VLPELVGTFSSGQTDENWPQKIKDELYTIAKEIYSRENDLEVTFESPTEIGISLEYLLRILIELTDNAIKFSRSGDKVLIKGKKEGTNYTFEIFDSGSGFVIKSIDDIEAFKQFNRRRLEQQGLGIGLYLVKQLIIFNKGSFHIHATEGHGTRVTVTLPLLFQY
jgi:signal transduction histidine kinase